MKKKSNNLNEEESEVTGTLEIEISQIGGDSKITRILKTTLLLMWVISILLIGMLSFKIFF